MEEKYEMKIKEEYLERVRDKKIIIWGTGSLYRKMKNIFDINVQEDVLFFIESFPKSKTFESKELFDSVQLLNKVQKKQEVVILICTSAWSNIKETISDELLESIDFYAPYEKIKWIFDKDDSQIVSVKKNVEKILLDYVGNLPAENKEKIIIMVAEHFASTHPFHFITLGVLLRMKGLNVCFLFNDLSNDSDLKWGGGYSKFQNSIIEDLLEKITEKYSIPYEKLSEQKEEELTKQEEQKLQQFVYYDQVWYSQKIIFDSSDKKLKQRKKKRLSNAKLIKSFLNKNNFDKVYTWTGVHSDWATLNILAKSIGLKTYSSEYIRGNYSFSIKEPAVFQKDIKLLNDYLFNKEQKDMLLEIANNHLENHYPYTSICDYEQPYVVMPLNIFWDSASYAEEDAFIYFDKWLSETIRFLIDECNVHVYVRQHPHERKFESGKDVGELLQRLFGRHPLFHFIDASSDEDTYKLIKHSKIVLPNTSTVGIEAAMMGKQVIVKNSVYYANSGFVLSAKSKDEYFKQIKKVLAMEKPLSNEQIDQAKIYFALTMLNGTDTFFGHSIQDVQKWSKGTINELLNNESVEWILDAIIDDIPLLNKQLEIEENK